MSLLLNGMMAFQMLYGGGQVHQALQPSLKLEFSHGYYNSASDFKIEPKDSWRLVCQTEKHKRNAMFEDHKVMRWVVPAVITIGAGSTIYAIYSVRGR